ncbi:MAG: inosine-5'-monophosphate dehydrogenase [Litorilinea sp.]|nr:MAG: inosine-5'-monophosphate dehydrogenase [Litorilinea sp.]
MKIRKEKGLTFDDVLLVPRRSPIVSRQDVDTSSWLTPEIRLQVPILSANMDTVTEAAMAIAMARAGAMGVLHRFMTIEQQVRQVERVKRAEGFIVENPYAIDQDATLEEARKLMERHDVGGLVVTNGTTRLIGLITQRDIMLAPDEHLRVRDVMTLPEQIVSVPPDISPDEARRILYEHRLEKLPVVDRAGNLVGLITAQDLMRPQRYPHATKDSKGRLRVGAAIGVTAPEMERAEALLAAGADVLVVDIAHGHAEHCIKMVKELRRTFPTAQIVAGNVATREGARDLAEAGADAIKVGIGPGSICTTRIVTGFGVPQLTAIMDSAAGVAELGRPVPIIADGGIKSSGDLVKALAAGASTVMIGSLFAGCEEAPGAPVIRDGQKVKVVRGMASLGAAIGRKAVERREEESAESQEDWDKVVPEGVEAVVPYRGHVKEILYQLVGGLRSGLSYGGARNIQELQEHAEFIEITPAGVRESHPHDVHRM